MGTRLRWPLQSEVKSRGLYSSCNGLHDQMGRGRSLTKSNRGSSHQISFQIICMLWTTQGSNH
jgi:hypothetical protein